METITNAMPSRRWALMKLGILFNNLVAAALAAPIGQFLLSSITRGRANGYLSWVSLGSVAEFPEGETRLATFRNPLVMPTDGPTVDTACWVRHVGAGQFQVFAINCAHLGCPVRWFPSPGCSCVRATAEHITGTARAFRVRPSEACSSIRIRFKTG